MLHKVEITPVRTYATEENAVKAVEKKFPTSTEVNLRYFISKTNDNRFFPVFIGVEALQYGVHFHFNVIG